MANFSKVLTLEWEAKAKEMTTNIRLKQIDNHTSIGFRHFWLTIGFQTNFGDEGHRTFGSSFSGKKIF